MIQAFIFKDNTIYDFGDHCSKIDYVDINQIIKDIENDNYDIISIQHNIIPNFYKDYNRWDRNIFTIIVKRRNEDDN